MRDTVKDAVIVIGMLILCSCISAPAQGNLPPSGQGHPLSIHEAIVIAIRNNPAVLETQQRVEAASGRVLRAGRIPNPELELNWSEIPTSFNVAESDQRGIGIKQTIEFPTRRSRRIEIAKYELQIAELELERVKALIEFAVKKAFYKTALSQMLIANSEEVISLLRQFLDLATVRYEAQMIPFLEILRAKVEIAKVTNQLFVARQTLHNDIAELNRLLGRAGSTTVVLADELKYVPREQSPVQIVDSLRRRNITVKIASLLSDRERIAVSLAGTSLLPDFTVGMTHQRLRGQSPFNANNYRGTIESAFGISVGISVPLWFWQGPQGEVREAEANMQIAYINRSAVEREVIIEIENGIRLLQAAEAQVRVYHDGLLKDVEDELSSGITLYKNNRIDALNLLEIYRTYTETRTEYYRALYNLNVALAFLVVAGEESVISLKPEYQ